MINYRQFFPILLLFACQVAYLVSAHFVYAVSYVEIFGLTPPAWDGGRTEFEMADINQDGHVDLLSIGDHGSPFINTDQHGIMVWLGDGAGNWTIHLNGVFGYGGLAVGDVNNDGYYDVGYGMHHNYSSTDFGNQLIEVALGDGSGLSWIPWDDGLATNGESWGMFGTDFGDVNHNGRLDLLSNSFGAGAGVHVYLNQGNGSWTQSFGFLGGNSTDDAVFGDINNDSHLDFVVAHQYGTAYFGDGAGGFVLNDTGLPAGGSLGRRGISLGDVDNDGGCDLAFARSGGIAVWIWDEDAQTWTDYSNGLPPSGDFQATQLFDMNIDGEMDVAAFGGGQFELWLGDGEGNWALDAQFSTPNPGTFAAFRSGGDIDHNGFPDIVLVAREGSWPSDKNEIHFFKEASVPGRLTVTPIFPRGRERFQEDSVCFIEWASGVPIDQNSYVKLEFTTNSELGDWSTLADSLPNNGRYQWIIPSDVSSDRCRLLYTVFSEVGSVEAITPYDFSIHGEITGLQEQQAVDLPTRFAVSASPNPFNPSTVFFLELPVTSRVSLIIYDIRGNQIRSLWEVVLPKGQHQILWDGRDALGCAVSSGTYIYRLEAGQFSRTGKVVLVR